MVVITEVDNGIGWIKINRPQVLNSINLEVVEQLTLALERWKNDDAVLFICLSGAGEKGFCAGGDMRKFYDMKDDDVVSYAEEFFSTEYRLDAMIHQYTKPIVAYMNGIVMGGGVGLSIGATHRIVTEKTKWAMPEMNIGFFPDVGASYFLNKMPGYVGRYLALTSKVIQASDTIYLGAADYYMESSDWETIENEMRQKQWIADSISSDLDDFVQSHCYKTLSVSPVLLEQEKIDRHFQYETVEEIVGSLQSEVISGNTWAEQTVNIILSKPPTSLKVALQQLLNGEKQSLNECLEMEKNMALHFMESADFYEGIRAVLVDKDHSPKWNPPSLQQVTTEDVEKYFSVIKV
ncbi:enoyl-CoA hydratase/isomerase family protein [Sporosarcina sp. P13]|uniref:enoyl-CoA hydratase/isomerase family protein n=1 Tax=Sporosarcina sp. P13 TaxID=2048263 RepID=UPI00130405F6|nr:enoyl-CoA hydratase/isomerase family protein [Sporosarcina sp. P13]